MRIGILFFLLAALAWNGEKITRSDTEWKNILGQDRHRVMRGKATEGAFLGKYVLTQTKGTYSCAACSLPLFSSADKYQAKVGWPTFTQPISPKNVFYLEDYKMGYKRYEVLCRHCIAIRAKLIIESAPTFFLYKRTLTCHAPSLDILWEFSMNSTPPRFLIMVTLAIFIFMAAAALLIVESKTSPQAIAEAPPTEGAVQ